MFYAFLTLAILASIMSVRVLVMLIRTSKSEERKRYALALVIGVPTVVFCYWRVLSWESADSSISDLVEKRQQELEKERKELEEMKKRLESFVGTEEEESTEEIDFEPAPRANGEQHGISKEFVVRDGKKILIRETPWVKGEVQGIEKNYYRHTGKLRYKMAWVHGRHEGEDKKYYRNGSLQAIIPWDDDKQDGTEKWYYRTGELYGKVHYENGDPTEEIWWDKQGNVIAEGDYKNGEEWEGSLCKPTNHWFGDHWETCFIWREFKKGILDGPARWVRLETGDVLAKGTYRDGKPWHGTFLKRDEYHLKRYDILKYKGGKKVSSN